MSSKKPSLEADPEKASEIRKRNAINTSNFRARQAANVAYMKKRVNEILAILNRPTIDFSKKKGPHVMKGKARPNHLPPEEERANMSEAQLSEWKAVQRKKRKASQARLRRMREDEMEKNLKKLWTTLEQEIAEKGEGEVIEPIKSANIIADSDGGEEECNMDQEDEVRKVRKIENGDVSESKKLAASVDNGGDSGSEKPAAGEVCKDDKGGEAENKPAAVGSAYILEPTAAAPATSNKDTASALLFLAGVATKDKQEDHAYQSSRPQPYSLDLMF